MDQIASEGWSMYWFPVTVWIRFNMPSFHDTLDLDLPGFSFVGCFSTSLESMVEEL